MARQDKRRGGEPCARDARGLLTYLREQLAFAQRRVRRYAEQHAVTPLAYYEARAAKLRRNIRWVLAARRAIERAGK